MFDNIFDEIKSQEAEFSALNMQVPSVLKQDFKKVCKHNKVTMTSAILKFMELAVHNAKVSNTNYEEDLINFD